MGNTVPPRGTGGRRPKNVVAEVAAAAAPRRVLVTPRRDDVEEEEEVTRPGRLRGGVPRARGGGADDVSSAPSGGVVMVKIVMTRKDAEALVARLNAQSARERKARMAELKGELRAGAGRGGASPASSRDAWRPGLAPIQEN
ncbi:uncharacterized protein LOC133918117 [Phragmites australis]|uniref:uncharacterized protein LOC133918117 n=1 Tax=Phragmites australis TaxID=29695 RepID=UPI002D78CCF6|nr:uncharacterized protein LOC133918117 [Phragmites australis]